MQSTSYGSVRGMIAAGHAPLSLPSEQTPGYPGLQLIAPGGAISGAAGDYIRASLSKATKRAYSLFHSISGVTR